MAIAVMYSESYETYFEEAHSSKYYAIVFASL